MPEDKTPGAIIVTPENLEEARPGYIVVKNEKGQLVLADPSFIVEELRKEVKEAANAVYRFDAFTRHVKHFKTLCKSHFINAFLIYKTKAMEGEIEVPNAAFLYADDAVLNGEKTVLQALQENNILNDIFIKIYGEYDAEEDKEGETLTFPEV